MDILEFYAEQSPFTCPGSKAEMYEGIPTSADEIVKLVQSIALDFNERPNYPIQNERLLETNDRYAEEMLQDIFVLDKKTPLSAGRPCDARMMAAPSHFATLCVSMLRNAGIPARSRYGFAVDGEGFKTYNVVEYFDGSEWKQADPCGKGDEFIFAGKAFQDARSGKVCGCKFENVEEKGIKVVVENLLLDLASLNKFELNGWDRYGWMLRPIDDYSEKAWEMLADTADVLLNKDKDLEALQAAYLSEEGFQVPEVVFCATPLAPGHKVALKK